MSVVYDEEFFDLQARFSLESARGMVPFILSVLKPKSVVDVGSGVGAWGSAFLENGVDSVTCLDGDYVNRDKLLVPLESFKPVDLNTASDIGNYDLACCLEVAEHLEERNAENFVKLLVSSAPVIVFSAAIPGQGGLDHVNEQWQTYWIKKFEAHGYLTRDWLRPLIWDESNIGAIYRQNVLLFCHPEATLDYDPPDSVEFQFNRIHEDFWVQRSSEMDSFIKRPATIKEGLATVLIGCQTICSRMLTRLGVKKY